MHDKPYIEAKVYISLFLLSKLFSNPITSLGRRRSTRFWGWDIPFVTIKMTQVGYLFSGGCRGLGKSQKEKRLHHSRSISGAIQVNARLPWLRQNIYHFRSVHVSFRPFTRIAYKNGMMLLLCRTTVPNLHSVKIKVTLFPRGGHWPVNYGVEVNKTATIGGLKEKYTSPPLPSQTILCWPIPLLSTGYQSSAVWIPVRCLLWRFSRLGCTRYSKTERKWN